MLIDTHAHMADPAFDADRAEVIERARLAGVAKVLTVGETLTDARRILELADHFDAIMPAAGLYPTYLDEVEAERGAAFITANASRLSAIGEVGLDYWKVQEPGERELQRRIFGRFIDLSLELDLPLNVHSRSAGRHAVAFLIDRGAKRVQLHAFDGKPASATPAVETGYFFSIPPSIVRSVQKQKLVKHLPLANLLVETDSPVLGADPDVRNEPANALISLRMIADLKGLELEEVREAVCENQHRLFGGR